MWMGSAEAKATYHLHMLDWHTEHLLHPHSSHTWCRMQVGVENAQDMGSVRHMCAHAVGAAHIVSQQYCLVPKSHPTLCDPMDCSPPGSLSMGFPRQES